jgi:hypothetical protein
MLSNISLYLFGLNLGWEKMQNAKFEIQNPKFEMQNPKYENRNSKGDLWLRGFYFNVKFSC